MAPVFYRSGIFYRPVHAIGWVIMLLAIGVEIYGFFDIDSRSHSASDTIRNAVFLGFLLFLAYTLVAWLVCRVTARD